MIDLVLVSFEEQLRLWGYVTIGTDLRDPMTFWLENKRSYERDGLFDLTEEYFQTTRVNGERPPWRHALLPATIKAIKTGRTDDLA